MVDSTKFQSPDRLHYDVVIVGGAMIGSSVAWFLSANPDFDGRILVVERDGSYKNSSTGHTNSCMRQQFSSALNIQISQFGAEFVRNFRDQMGGGEDVPDIHTHFFGYMYLAADEGLANALREASALQVKCGAGTKLMTVEQIAKAYPFYHLDDIILGSHNLRDEGYFDGGTMFTWLGKSARANGVTYLTNEVVGIDVNAGRVTGVRLASGETIATGMLVNASGPRGAKTAAMAGLQIPVEPRKRYTFIFDSAVPLGGDLPLTIDPSGIHCRTDGLYFMAGCAPEEDYAVDYDDFVLDHDIWEEKIWPALANRIPAFEAIKLISSWAGHYAYNTLDQNAIIGAHPDLPNFLFVNGFSGHGLQQSPAMGRGISELVTYGEFRELDMSRLGVERIINNDPLIERAVI